MFLASRGREELGPRSLESNRGPTDYGRAGAVRAILQIVESPKGARESGRRRGRGRISDTLFVFPCSRIALCETLVLGLPIVQELANESVASAPAGQTSSQENPPAGAGSPSDAVALERIQRLEELRKQRALSGRERMQLLRARKATAPKVEGEEKETESPASKPGPDSDTEIAEHLAVFFGGVVFPLLGLFAPLFGGKLEELSEKDERELGLAFIPWGRRFRWLVMLAKWAGAPSKLLRKVRQKFQPTEPPEATASQAISGALNPPPQTVTSDVTPPAAELAPHEVAAKWVANRH